MSSASPIDSTCLRSMLPDDLAELVAASEQPSYRRDQLLNWLYEKRASSFADMSNLPADWRSELEDRYTVDNVVTEQEIEDREGTVKLLGRLRDGRKVESVLMPQQDRNSLCISSQAGCALGCTFCVTATMGLLRNLDSSEIVNQVVAAERRAGGRMDSIVFMGMGEPLANIPNVCRAIRIITHPDCLGYSPRRITVSTAGITSGLRQLAAENLRVNLAFSLNAPTARLRSDIMPINDKHPLDELIGILEDYPVRPWQEITIEYVLLRGINDQPEHAYQVANLLRNVTCKINVIPLNEAPELPYTRPPRKRIIDFQNVLRDEGYRVYIRDSKGQNIRAACGQLATEAAA